VTPGLPRGNQAQQPQNGYHNQKQQQHQHQYQLPSQNQVALPHQQPQLQQQQQSRATNSSSYANYQQVTNPAHKPYDQAQFQPRIQQQQSSSITPSKHSTVPAVAAPSTQQIVEAWKEYTAPGGVKYYHNELLKESTYTMPDALMNKTASNPSSSTSANATAASSQKRSWQEHEDAKTGRRYYSNGVQTTWEKPDGFESPETIVANTSFQPKREDQSGRDRPSKKKKRMSIGEGVNENKSTGFANKKEATTAFKGFLLAKGISPTLKWNEVLKICESDSRWDSYETVLSLGERRQALAEYQTKRTNEIRNEQRQERIRAKEAFGQLLADILPSISGFSARSSRFADARNSLSKDDRFFAVEDESTRESLFLDFCDDFKKREERSKRNKKREAQESFVSFLEEREEDGTLTYASTWESFLLSLSEEDKTDSHFVTSKTLNDSDRQLYFADFVLALQKTEDEKRRRIEDARRRAEKAQRDQYRDLLRKMAADGKILPHSRWREIEDFLVQEDSFKLVESQDRGAPREIFEVFADEWDERYRLERNFLSRLLRPPGRPDVVISAGTSFENFKKIITEESAYSSEIQNETFRIVNREDPVSSARLLFDELTAQTESSKRSGTSRRGSTNDDSSEDEGEIIEDGEVVDNDSEDVKQNELQ
jgi:pre-mRNA-processing factor 40